MKNYILQIETSTDICSVSISDGASLLAICESETPSNHASWLTVGIQQALDTVEIAAADLSAVAVSAGPGSYTGLRIGASVAKGMCYALDIPLVAVDTLAALARTAMLETAADCYISMIDARRMEVYCAIFDRQLHQLAASQPLIIEKDIFNDFLERGKVVLCGDGVLKLKNTLVSSNFIWKDNLKCSASHLVFDAWKKYTAQIFESVAYFEPIYLKAPNITTSKKKLF